MGQGLMVLAGFAIVFWYGWHRGRISAGNHICEMAPEVLTPWLPPDLHADRPPKDYITVPCADPECESTVDLPISATIKHVTTGAVVIVKADATDLSLHELGHKWR